MRYEGFLTMGKWVVLGSSLLLLTLLLTGCASKPEEASLAWQITFFPIGAKIQFGNEPPVERVSAFSADGTLVAQLNFPTPPRQIESLYFEWREAEVYKFEATLSTGQIHVQRVTAPKRHIHGSIELAIPYGAAKKLGAVHAATETPRKALVLQGSEMTATVVVTNGNSPSAFEVELCLPATLTIVQVPADWRSETTGAETCLSTTGTFRIASEVYYREFVLKIPIEKTEADSSRRIPATISGRVRFKTDTGEISEQTTAVVLDAVTISEIAEHLSIESIQMPTDAVGSTAPRHRPDTIVMVRKPSENAYSLRVLEKFGIKPRTSQVDAFEPIAHQTVHLRNRSAETIHVVVSSINRDTKSGEPVRFLTPPDAVNAGTGRSIAFASLPGETVMAIPLPLYFHPQAAEAGTYQREIEVKVLGSNATILREQRPLYLIVPNRHALFVSGVAIVISSIGLAILLGFHQRFFARFTTKQLIVIALFGTTIFVAVVVPSTLFLNLIRALLGPFSGMLSGLINETLYYALLTALLIYINGAPGGTRKQRSSQRHDELRDNLPNMKGGVILLVSAVHLLLGGVTFGSFTPMQIVYTGTSVILLETGFLLIRRRGLFAWAVALAICDAIAVYVEFQLSILFYRLFFADWYIVLRILIEGFAYTFIGVLVGSRLGRGLWKVAE